MKEVGYALTVSVVAATHFSIDVHSAWLDACYTVRGVNAEPSQAVQEHHDSTTEPIHWASGLHCFTVFYFGLVLLALAHRRADPDRSRRIWYGSVRRLYFPGRSSTLSDPHWMVYSLRCWRRIEALAAHAFRVIVYKWVVLPAGLQLDNYACAVHPRNFSH
jgi:hypothetical protein